MGPQESPHRLPALCVLSRKPSIRVHPARPAPLVCASHGGSPTRRHCSSLSAYLTLSTRSLTSLTGDKNSCEVTSPSRYLPTPGKFPLENSPGGFSTGETAIDLELTVCLPKCQRHQDLRADLVYPLHPPSCQPCGTNVNGLTSLTPEGAIVLTSLACRLAIASRSSANACS